MVSLRQTEMKLGEMTWPGWGDMPNYLRESDDTYTTAQSLIPVVIQAETKKCTATSAMTIFAECIETHDTIPVQSQMPWGTSQPRSSQM